MSLTTEITGLTSEVRALTQRVDAWVDDADARITSAVRAIPQMRKKVYVHPTVGDNAAPGTQGEPVATVAEAVRRGPASGQLVIYLLDDVMIDEPINAEHLLRIFIVGDGQRRRLGFGAGYEAYWDGYGLDGLYVRRDATLVNLAIDYPSTTASPPTDRPIVSSGLIRVSHGIVSLWDCIISGAAPSIPLERHVIDPIWYVDIILGGGTSWSSDVASHLIRGVPAGTDPNALPNLRSNITTV